MSRPNGSPTMALALLGLMLLSFTCQCYGQLQVGFYKGKCKVDVEDVVLRILRAKISKDRSLAAALLRMHFHDCFVHGCDASLLIDGPTSEKNAAANGSVRGFEVIDEIKAALEQACPGIVSCADIVALAARVSVALTGGMWYNLPTGRRDGRVALASDVDLPSPELSVSDTIQAFAKKGLSVNDMVYLLGAHTIGVTHCFFVEHRLYDFQNTGAPDRTMNPSLASLLRRRCPRGANSQAAIPLNANTKNINQFDNSFYTQLLNGRGILTIDQEMGLDSLTKNIVRKLAADNKDFLKKFGQSMINMGNVGVLTGKQGEIRRSCRAFN